MVYLFISILASTGLFVLFRLFKSNNINTLQAIVVNYIVASSCGALSYSKPITFASVFHSEWLYGALILGVLFILVFNVMSLTAQKNGIAVASVATKMSLVIPIIFGVFLYQEALYLEKVVGIVLALLAVYLTASSADEPSSKSGHLLFPILLFFGSGIIDSSLKYFETHFVSAQDVELFSSTIFLVAAILGFVVLFVKQKLIINLRTVIAGIVLGVVNYYSVYFLIKSLQIETLASSTIFTINNVGIVLLSTLVAFMFFREQLSKKNWVGIALAIISIAIISLF